MTDPIYSSPEFEQIWQLWDRKTHNQYFSDKKVSQKDAEEIVAEMKKGGVTPAKTAAAKKHIHII